MDIKCSLCGCEGIHACMGKPTTEFKATKENLKALVAEARKADNKPMAYLGDPL